MEVEITRPPLLGTFELPARDDLLALQGGDYVKLIFSNQERMWVELLDCSNPNKWLGALNNRPVLVDMDLGDFVEFHPSDVIDFEKNKEKTRKE